MCLCSNLTSWPKLLCSCVVLVNAVGKDLKWKRMKTGEKDDNKAFASHFCCLKTDAVICCCLTVIYLFSAGLVNVTRMPLQRNNPAAWKVNPARFHSRDLCASLRGPEAFKTGPDLSQDFGNWICHNWSLSPLMSVVPSAPAGANSVNSPWVSKSVQEAFSSASRLIPHLKVTKE